MGYNLTPREKEVALLKTEGLLNKEIADKLVISIFTVKQHQHNIYLKLKVKNRIQLMNKLRTNE